MERLPCQYQYIKCTSHAYLSKLDVSYTRVSVLLGLCVTSWQVREFVRRFGYWKWTVVWTATKDQEYHSSWHFCGVGHRASKSQVARVFYVAGMSVDRDSVWFITCSFYTCLLRMVAVEWITDDLDLARRECSALCCDSAIVNPLTREFLQ